MGAAGQDQLTGWAGADTLYARTGADTLSGGAGADVFVVTADGRADQITDFEPGLDRIRLDNWGMVYDISALEIRATP